MENVCRAAELSSVMGRAEFGVSRGRCEEWEWDGSGHSGALEILIIFARNSAFLCITTQFYLCKTCTESWSVVLLDVQEVERYVHCCRGSL